MLSRPHFGPRIEFWSSRRPRSKPWPRFEATTKTDEHYWTGEYFMGLELTFEVGSFNVKRTLPSGWSRG